MEETKIEIEIWKTHPDFAELCEAFLSADELKTRLIGRRCIKIGPPELIFKIYEVEALFETKKEKCLDTSRFTFWLLLGMTYKLSLKFIDKCVEALGKAVKIKWELHGLWNEIGELYWLTDDKDLARNCFERGLKMAKNPRSFRNLSRAVRTMDNPSRETMETGIQLAKEAIQLNVNDHESWTVLGHAHLSASLYFNRDKNHAQKALAAYRIAERQENSSDSLDMFHNMAMVLAYLEKYDESLDKLDACLRIDNTWQEAICFRNLLINYVLGIKEGLMTETSADIKMRQKILRAIKWDQPSDPKFQSNKTKVTPFNELKEGLNRDVNIFGKVIWSSFVDQSFPYVVGFMDQDGNTLTVKLINAHLENLFNIGDVLFIRNPQFENISFKFFGEAIEYPAVKVTDMSMAALNGTPLSAGILGR